MKLRSSKQPNYDIDSILSKAKGTFLDQWEVVEYLGSGSFGDVYKIIKDTRLGVQVSALKIIRLSEDEADDLQKTLTAMTELSNEPNAVHIEDFAEITVENTFSSIWYVLVRMELLNPIASGGFSEPEVIKLALDMCRVLEVCHNRTPKILHCDIKPDNIMCTDKGVYKLSDFGQMRQLSKSHISNSGRHGSPAFMSPEMYMREGYDQTSDIYSLGITMYALLNDGLLPFYYGDYSDFATSVSRRFSGEGFPNLPDVSSELQRIISKMSYYDRRQRYQNVSEVAEDLKKHKDRMDAQPATLYRTKPRSNSKTYYSDYPTVEQGSVERDIMAVYNTAVHRNEQNRYPGREERRFSTAEGHKTIATKRDDSPYVVMDAEFNGICADLDEDNPYVYSYNVSMDNFFVMIEIVEDCALTQRSLTNLNYYDESARISCCKVKRRGIDYYAPKHLSIPAVLNVTKGTDKNKGKTRLRITKITTSDYLAKSKLTSLDISYGIEIIGSGAFSDCNRLELVNLPAGLVYIESDAFRNCASLENIVIPEGVRVIGNGAFSECRNLRTVTIPDSVTKFGRDTFRGCPRVTIRCRRYSAAEDFARSKNIQTTLIY